MILSRLLKGISSTISHILSSLSQINKATILMDHISIGDTGMKFEHKPCYSTDKSYSSRSHASGNNNHNIFTDVM